MQSVVGSAASLRGQAPISRVLDIRVPCPRVPGCRVPESRISGAQGPGSQGSGFRDPGSQSPGSQVLILDYAEKNLKYIRNWSCFAKKKKQQKTTATSKDKNTRLCPRCEEKQCVMC